MAITGNDLERILHTVGLELVTRAEWGARAPKSTPSQIPMPTAYCYIHHAAVEGSDDAAEMRGHQNFHMDTRGFNDIAYNLVLPDPNPDRVVFEGRGVGIRGGHLLGDENVTSHGIMVMGDFNKDRPSENTLNALADLCRLGRDKGWWKIGLRGHRDSPTISPGKNCPGDFMYPRLDDLRRMIDHPEEDLKLDQEDQKFITDQLRRAVGHLMHGDSNALVNSEQREAIRDKGGRPIRAAYNAAVAAKLDPAQLAAAIVAKLPAGGVDQATVEAGVRAVLGTLDD